MTPRDHFAAAALTALVRGSRTYCDEDLAVLADSACAFAEAVARQACARWGHLYERTTDESARCIRCGVMTIRRCDHCKRPKGSGPGTCDCVPF